MSTNVPSPTLGSKGFVAPLETDILAGVAADINAAMGGGLNPSPATPQGQIAASETAILGFVNDLFLLFQNQVDPARAQGLMQDAIGRIYFLERFPAQASYVPALCTGAAGVTIPVGATAVDAAGNLWSATQTATIGVSGNVTLNFACQKTGPVACQAGALTQIYQSIPGWDTISNVVDATLGNDVESRDAFERRRALSVAHNSIGALSSIRGKVLSVANVIDAYVVENDTNAPLTIGNVTLVPNSIYVCVAGGDANDVARAIWTGKAPGCVYNGNTVVTVQDTGSGYVPPYPSYSVLFQTASDLETVVAVTITNGPLVPADALTQVQNAIVAAFAGEDGGARATIATEFYASRLYATIAALGAWARIVSIEIGSANAPAAVFTGWISGTILSVTAISAGAIAIGQTLIGANGDIIAGTNVTGFISGTGGVGTYAIDTAQSIPPETMSAVTATNFVVQPNLDQIPTVSVGNISLNLA